MIRELNLFHYTNEPFEFERNYQYDQNLHKWQAKPVGLWFSVEGPYDWKWWCISEEFRIDHLAISYKISLKENSNILYLTDKLQMEYFTKKYILRKDTISRIVFGEDDTNELDWNKVKKDYQGIIISPYQWECRLALETSWYYGWDCESGCIWDLNCIETFECINQMAQTNG